MKVNIITHFGQKTIVAEDVIKLKRITNDKENRRKVQSSF